MSEFYKAAVLIQNHGDFDEWEYLGVGAIRQVDGLGPVQLAAIERDETEADRYGEYPQGYEGEIGLVFKVVTPDGTLFIRKSGTKDSYGSESWTGPIVEVRETTKTVTAFERV